eukprot:1132591-Heterocapsa_arctica.AAC.1
MRRRGLLCASDLKARRGHPDDVYDCLRQSDARRAPTCPEATITRSVRSASRTSTSSSRRPRRR